MKVLWARSARNDRRRITAWLAERNLPAAVRIAQALSDAIDDLTALPYKGRPGRAPDTRELSAVPPYVMVYEVDDDAQVIQILRVWHAAQNR